MRGHRRFVLVFVTVVASVTAAPVAEESAEAIVEAGGRLCMPVRGAPGDIAVVNVTPLEAVGPGSGQLVSSDVVAPPVASNVNFVPGSIDPNVAVAPIGADGSVCFVNSPNANVNVVLDHLVTCEPVPSHPRRRERPSGGSTRASASVAGLSVPARRDAPPRARDLVRCCSRTSCR